MDHEHGGHEGMAMSMPMGKKAAPGEYSKHQGHSIDEFKRKFYVSMVLTVPVLVLSPAIQSFLNVSFRFSGDIFVLFLFSSVVFFYGGLPFLRGALNELKHRLPGMMVLISLAIIVAYFYSSAVALGLRGEIFFWELATLIDIMLFGHWLEMRSVMGASRALEKLSELIPDTAHLISDGKETEVNSKDLKDGNIILVKPGEKIPSDGVVVGGQSFVNESMLTGESKPVGKKADDTVIGGSINAEGALRIKVKGVGESSYLSKVITLVKTAQASKSRTQVIADKAALILTVVAILTSAVTFIVWLSVGGDVAFAIERAATVLIIACPHALGLAVPLVVSISTTLSAQNGLLIKNRVAFENSRKISTIIFDKTGTLTEGVFALTKIFNFSKLSDSELLAIAATLEKNSEHPIGKAIALNAIEKNIKNFEVENFAALKGKGVEGKINGNKYLMASPGYLGELGLTVPSEVGDTYGTNVFLLNLDKKILLAVFSLSDKIRQESFEAVKILKKEGIKLWMLTGDNKKVAEGVSKELKLDGFFAEVLPDKKQDKIRELQEKGEYVAMVGDGINDAPALAKADVGIAIGSGTDIANETADIILVNSSPKDIAHLIRFGKATYSKMVQNLWWATGYNIIAIPLAAGVLSRFGIMLSPALGAVFMSLSTIIVAINAKTLRVRK